MFPLNKTTSRHIGILVFLLLLGVFTISQSNLAPAQDSVAQESIDAADIQAILNDDGETEVVAPPSEPRGIDLLSLISSGGKFMIPIGLMSLLVVTLAVERLISFRQQKILPSRLVDDLEELCDPISQFNPSTAYHACLDNPSPLARVVGAMLLRTGQPLGEIERTASDTVQREADRYSAPIRWLNLAAAATPLMGLLGTVWGMIVAFHESTTLTADRSRSEQLSEGIYTALVTTLAGLIVAIPAAILAQYLENRVRSLFHQIEQVAFDVAPGLARFTARRRLDPDGTMRAMETTSASHTTASVAPPPPPPPIPNGDASTGAKGAKKAKASKPKRGGAQTS